MKKNILLVLCFSISQLFSMEKPPEEQWYWAIKKSHEKNPRRLKEEHAQKIDLDELACHITYKLSLIKQTGMVKFSPDKDPTTHDFRKKWYYGRKINTLLLNACAYDRNHEVVKQLLTFHANPNVKIDRRVIWANEKVMLGEVFETPLFTAVQHQAERNVELLLQAGARVTTLQGLQLETVLHYACSNKDSSPETKKNIISLLLAHGANPNALTTNRANCLYSLVQSRSYDQSYITLLLEYGLDSRIKFPLFMCCNPSIHEQICDESAKYARPMALFRVLWKRAQNSDFKRLPREIALQIAKLVYREAKLQKVCISSRSIYEING